MTTTENRYSVDEQLRYVITWFNEWSEMQRDDFSHILAQCFAKNSCQLNGLSELSLRPPSLFQCRVKLFREWSQGWGETERLQFIDRLSSIDVDFIAKYQVTLKALEGGGKISSNSSPTTPTTNGVEIPDEVVEESITTTIELTTDVREEGEVI